MVLVLATYYVYILTNYTNKVLYIGVINHLSRRLFEHAEMKEKTFVGKYKLYKLIYWESFENINLAIDREKQLKRWKRGKKNKLVEAFNPNYLDFAFCFKKRNICRFYCQILCASLDFETSFQSSTRACPERL